MLIKKMLLSGSVGLLLCAAFPLHAHAGQDWLPALGGALKLHDPEGKPLGILGKENEEAAWIFYQWRNPVSLPAIRFPATQDTWTVANPHAKIRYNTTPDGQGSVYEIEAQNVPCQRGPYFESSEQNLFFQTEVKPDVKHQSLADLGQLMLSVDLNAPYSVTTSTRCPYNFSKFTFSLIFNTVEQAAESNRPDAQPQPQPQSQLTSQPPKEPQTLFLQIILGNTDGSFDDIAWCPDYERNDQHFKNAFCVDDSIVNFGGRHTHLHTKVSQQVDILPRLLQIIRAGHQKMGNGLSLDTNPAHWKLGTVYFGMITYGGQITATQWSQVGLSAQPGGAWCTGADLYQWSCEGAAPQGRGWVRVDPMCYQKRTRNICE